MKCALVFLSVLALGCALPLLQGASIQIAVAADGTISIYGTSGNKLVISRVWKHAGQKNVEVFAGVEHGAVKKILVNHETTLKHVDALYQTGMTEADVLIQIFRNYQGEVDVNAYTHLLRAVLAHVHTGHVRMAVYNILKTFIANEVGLDTSMTNYVTPQWYSLYNILGSRQTGLESTQTFNKAEEFPSIHEASFHVAIANDDTISIHGASGNKLVVSKVLKHLGNKNVVVYLGVEHGEMNEILLDQEFTMEHSYDEYHTDSTEADVLVQIFKHYQGDVDMYTYTNLLKQVYVQVQAGHVRMAVHNVLKNFFIHEINWARFVASGAYMGQHTAPEWQSLFNLKNTESDYGSDYSTELRNNLGYSEHMQKVTPENYYGWNLNAFTRPIYQRVQRTKWLPQQQNTHNNFMNTPFVY